MEDILDDNVEETEESQSIWDMLNIDDPGPEPYEEEQVAADAEVAKDDKMVKKLTAKMDSMQKKFESTMMKERIGKFQDGADDLEKSLFKTIAADVKDMETLDKAMELVQARAKTMREEAEKYKAQLEKQAEEQVAKAWGTSPTGTPTPRTEDEEKKIAERIAAGDTKAAFMALMEGDTLMGR